MKIYVASSWRNIYQQNIVKLLRAIGNEVYDFRNPTTNEYGFAWSQIDPDYKAWRTQDYIKLITEHPLAIKGFNLDYDAMTWADTCVLVMPCGRSAHIEAGYFNGARKNLIIYIPEPCEPELMYKMANRIITTEEELIKLCQK